MESIRNVHFSPYPLVSLSLPSVSLWLCGRSYHSSNHERAGFASSVTVVPSNFVRLNPAKFSL
jgi:hypothetical protein